MSTECLLSSISGMCRPVPSRQAACSIYVQPKLPVPRGSVRSAAQSSPRPAYSSLHYSVPGPGASVQVLGVQVGVQVSS